MVESIPPFHARTCTCMHTHARIYICSIGFSIAKCLAKDGARVMVSSRKQENVERAVEELRGEKGVTIEGRVCHVGKAEHRKKLIEEVCNYTPCCPHTTVSFPYHTVSFPYHSVSFPYHQLISILHTALFQVLATSDCNSVNRVSQSESRIQILLQFDWMAWFSLLQPDVARTWKSAVAIYHRAYFLVALTPQNT